MRAAQLARLRGLEGPHFGAQQAHPSSGRSMRESRWACRCRWGCRSASASPARRTPLSRRRCRAPVRFHPDSAAGVSVPLMQELERQVWQVGGSREPKIVLRAVHQQPSRGAIALAAQRRQPAKHSLFLTARLLTFLTCRKPSQPALSGKPMNATSDAAVRLCRCRSRRRRAGRSCPRRTTWTMSSSAISSLSRGSYSTRYASSRATISSSDACCAAETHPLEAIPSRTTRRPSKEARMIRPRRNALRKPGAAALRDSRAPDRARCAPAARRDRWPAPPTAARACRGAAALRENLRGASHLHDPAQIHDGDAARNVTHQPQVVCNEQIGELQLLLQIHQQVDHLRLDRDVERRHRFVGDDERRIERQRPRQADALPLAAAELVRIAIEVRRIEADQPEQLGDAIAPLGLRADAVDDQRLFDDRRAPACAD